MNNENFQPIGERWEERAEKEGLRSVLDPGDYKGTKNKYIDILHKLVLSDHLPSLKNKKVLDFGCGTGRLNPYLRNKGAEVIGVDITKEMIVSAKKRYPEQFFIFYDGKRIPFENNYFDYVISILVFQHINPMSEMMDIANELLRSVKKGGRIFLIEQSSEKKSGYYIHKEVEDYISAFKRCKCICKTPIRRSSSLLTSMVSRNLIPSFIFPIVAKIDIFLAKIKKNRKNGYIEYFFVFEKNQDE